MIALFALAFAADPVPAASLTPPAAIATTPRFSEPIRDFMSPRTIGAVDRPGMVLLEWDGMPDPPAVGTFVDVWTRKPTGPCTLAQRVAVVLGPAADGDLKHTLPVLSVTRAQVDVLQRAAVVGWSPRNPDDSREHASVACK